MGPSLLFIGNAWFELLRFHAMRSVDAIPYPVQTQRQQARAELEVSCVSSAREVGVTSGASGLAQGCPRPAEGHKHSDNGEPELHLHVPFLDGSSQALQMESLDGLDAASVAAVDHHVGESSNLP